MSFSPTFGSFGDFVSLSIIIKEFVVALDDARGSTSEYRALVKDLNVLDHTLLQIYQVCQVNLGVPELQQCKDAAFTSVEACRWEIDAFKQHVQKYDESLGKDSGSSLRTSVAKIQWRLQGKELEKFRVKTANHRSNMDVILSTASIKLAHLNEQKRQSDNTTWTQTLSSYVSEAANLSKEVLSLSRRVIFQNLLIYREVMAIRSTQLASIERPLPEEFFMLEDAVGRVVPIHLRTIDSWEAFNTLLIVRFKDRRGAKRVAAQRYTLQEQESGRLIRRDIPWSMAVRPRLTIYMSIICKESMTPNTALSSCPNCHTVPASSLKSSVRWWVPGQKLVVSLALMRNSSGCGTMYQRTSELNDDETSRSALAKRMPKPVSGDSANLAWDLNETNDSDEEDTSLFTNIQLVARKRHATVGLGKLADEKRFVCEFCSKSFSKAIELR
ncbi:uncharacterized protein JN550_003436 [Neoarthrinium moseri]|uniref:uncharacterized protein n=1 Tax=Neoarthrinium moseri TaxID=1658444 RepID=UPI001FDD8C12|nr:uncharacterized protein JN550_003436 [Neoarthrinium moseri]KAI1873183.1 hypothetical protein JN550_003436 [Neoarthrinium moseri]